MGHFSELLAYQKGFSVSMEIYEVSKKFPQEEKYSLTDQVRRSSRSVCANISEAYGKRRYPKNFISKLSDSDSENLETQSWLKFALACKYIDQPTYDKLSRESEEVGKLIGYMMNNPGKFR